MLRSRIRHLTVWALAAGLTLAAVESASAQDQPADRSRLDISAKGGLSVTGLTFSGGDGFFENERGIIAGVSVTRDLFSVFGVTVEAMYHRKGAGDIFIGQRIQIDYVDIPVLLRVNTGIGPSDGGVYGFVGPAVGLRLRAKFGDVDVTDNYESSDVSLVGGGGATFGRFLVELRVNWGLRNVAVDLVGFGTDTIKNRSVSVLGGFRIR